MTHSDVMETFLSDYFADLQGREDDDPPVCTGSFTAALCVSQLRTLQRLTSWPTLLVRRMTTRKSRGTCLSLSSLTDRCSLATTSRCLSHKGPVTGCCSLTC
ncbi:hypothetical protein QTP70_035190 [Hemibagrus guttatus]|uniref:Uncharacterized protein n=1 Tax=Hemibagrus guttatus TaxID=175788 RepID=A0AAE0PYX6_9TELE|nr:hypothetical protein QTP70_035190 [Hemibagrus guttatus]